MTVPSTFARATRRLRFCLGWLAATSALTGSAQTAAALAAGDDFSLVLLDDGRLLAGGRNRNGQLGDGSLTDRTFPVPTAAGVAVIAAGGGSSFQIRFDGSLYAAGANGFGQLGNGNRLDQATPVRVAGFIRAVATSATHTLALQADGTVLTTGSNLDGALGDQTFVSRESFRPVATLATAVAAGSHSAFVHLDGYLSTFGANTYRQLGHPLFPRVEYPLRITPGVVAVACGQDNTAFIKSDGTLWVAGRNDYGQLGAGNRISRDTPVAVATHVAAAVFGRDHLLFIRTDGSLWAAGRNESGQLGDGTTTDRPLPVRIASDVAAVAAGTRHSLFIAGDGSVWGMGANVFGALGPSDAPIVARPQRLPLGPANGNLPPHRLELAVSPILTSDPANTVVGRFSAADPDGTVFTYRLVAGVGATHNARFTVVGDELRAVNPAALAPGTYRVRVLVADGRGGAFARTFAVTVRPGPSTAVAARLAGGYQSVLFVRPDGTLRGLGSNGTGELGVGPLPTKGNPALIATDVTLVSADRAGTAYFAKSDGSLWEMGTDRFSPRTVGNTSVSNLTPVRIGGGAPRILASGEDALVYVDSSGRLFGRGINRSGNLGLGDTARRSVPVLLQSGVLGAAVGSGHVMHLRTDGTLWAAGANDQGQLGDGTTTDRLVPVQVATDVAAVSAGGKTTCFIKRDGTLWSMGSNQSVPDGGGEPGPAATPRLLASDVRSASAGQGHILYVKSDTSLWAVGYNGNGQLGDGTYSHRPRPVRIDTGVVAASAGYLHSLYEKTDGSLWFMGWGAAVGEGVAGLPQPVRIQAGPANDTRAGAQELSGLRALFSGRLGEATREADDPGAGPIELLGSLWFRWTAPMSGPSRLDFHDARVGIYLGVYVAAADGTLQRLAADAHMSAMSFAAEAGRDYYIMVDRWSAEVAEFTGAIELEPTPGAPGTAFGTASFRNLSVLAATGTGSEVLTAGISLSGGTGFRDLLIRGIGPTLSAFETADPVADPLLTVFRGTTLFDRNDDWSSADHVRSAMATVGAFPMSPGSRDAVSLRSGYGTGTYLATLESKNGVGRRALIEVYEMPASGPTGINAARLTNLSVRTYGGPGADTLATGFAIGGSGAARVLIRASGPGLAQFGLTGVMPDPKIALYYGQRDKIAENDNWAAANRAEHDAAGAFRLPPDSKDAALLATLGPGTYSVQIFPQDGQGGLVLIELYTLP